MLAIAGQGTSHYQRRRHNLGVGRSPTPHKQGAGVDYIITAHKGAGKSKLAVSLAVNDYLRKGKRVASNITLNLDQALDASSRVTALKLPYIPAKEHLDALGNGYPELDPLKPSTYDESKFGLVILDEAGSWLNSRNWNDSARAGLFTWLTHARKYGWDVALIIQDLESLDAQIRRSIMECYVECRRLDRVKVPYLPVTLPKIFKATAYYGGPGGFKHKTWYSEDGSDKWYFTGEAIRPENLYTDDGPVDMRATFTMLSAWHLAGRYLPKPEPRFALVLIALKWLYLVSMRTLTVALGKKPHERVSMQNFRLDLARVFPKMLIALDAIPFPHLRKRRKPVGVVVAHDLASYNLSRAVAIPRGQTASP